MNHYKTKYFEYSDEEIETKNNEDEDEEFIIHSKREIS